MKKYIDAERIRAEIERRRDFFYERYVKKGRGCIEESRYDECVEILSFIDSLPDCKVKVNGIGRVKDEVYNSLLEEKKGCGVEFPHFGANYPDGKCINGYLWDMDSYEDGCYTIGGDDPCPICNTEEWVKNVLDDEIFETREDALEYVKMLKSKYKYKDPLTEKPSEDLEEAANEYVRTASDEVWGKIDPKKDLNGYIARAYYSTGLLDGFRAGAEWQREQMNKEQSVDYAEELKKCKENPLYFWDKYVKIKHKPVEVSEYLNEAAEKYRLMMEDATDGVVIDTGNFIKFKDGKFIDLNPTEGEPCFKFQDGDKVKVIIIKEDEK